MPISDFIAHQIDRLQPDQPTKVKYRDNSINLDDYASQLLNEIKQTFSSKALKRYGQFNADLGENPLPAWLREYLKQQIPFSTLSRKLTEHFVVLLEQKEIEFHGHLLFWQEHNPDADWLHIAHLQHQTGLAINSRLEVSETFYADLSHVGFCARINFTQLVDETAKRYLTISKNRGERGLQEIFNQWIGFTDTINTTADTNEFLDIVEAYAESLPEDTSKAYREKVVDYCMEQDKQGEPIIYKELSYYLDDAEPERFERFVQEKQEQPREELIPDKSQLRKYVRFSGRSKEMSLQFAASMLGEEVEFDAQNERLIINKIPKSLLGQLKKHRRD